jgi:Uma2 family endonuclease
MVLVLPDDGKRYELFDGELLVSPAPNGIHQLTLVRLFEVIAPFVRTHHLGETIWSPADLSLGGEELAQPDLFVMPFLPPDRRDWSAYPDPILVIEVLSPSTARYDRIVKRRRFQRAGIPEYWIVDPESRSVERWRPGDDRPEVLDGLLAWHPEGAPAALEIVLPDLFRSIWGAGG